MTRITVTGAKELSAALSAMSQTVASEVDELVLLTAVEVEARLKLAIQGGAKSGRVYKRGKVWHRASAPGQAPASDTGALIASIMHEKDAPLTASVGSRLAYAVYLEFGTVKMAPRPLWVPEAEATAKEFRADLEALLTQVTQ